MSYNVFCECVFLGLFKNLGIKTKHKCLIYLSLPLLLYLISFILLGTCTGPSGGTTDPGFRFCLFLKGTATRTESAAAFILAVNSYTCILVSEVDDHILLVFVELNHLKSGKKDLSIFPQRVIEA